jgi:hypothetical protein
LARDRVRRELLIALGLARPRTFSWERAARETLDVYRLAANPAAGRPAPERAAFTDVGVKRVPSVAGPHAAHGSQQSWIPGSPGEP